MKTEVEIVEIVCPECGNNKSYKRFLDQTEFGECTACGGSTYRKGAERFCSSSIYETPKARCPYCNSTDTKKISTMSKVGSVALWGIFAVGKTSKQWHCNNCKSDF